MAGAQLFKSPLRVHSLIKPERSGTASRITGIYHGVKYSTTASGAPLGTRNNNLPEYHYTLKARSGVIDFNSPRILIYLLRQPLRRAGVEAAPEISRAGEGKACCNVDAKAK